MQDYDEENTKPASVPSPSPAIPASPKSASPPSPPSTPPETPVSYTWTQNYDEEDEEPTFLQRHRPWVLLVCFAIFSAGGYAFYHYITSHQSSGRSNDIEMVQLPPPPPPPRPQPTPTPDQQPTPEQEQKMVEQQPVENEQKQQPKPPDAPAAPGTNITGPGGMDMGLGRGNGSGFGPGGGGGPRSKYGWYASEVQSRVRDAMTNNPRTRNASMNVVVRIWPDPSGRVAKVRIAGTTGDSAVDSALRDEVLNGLQIGDPPPSDMPLPIVLRLTAQRPH